MLGRRKVGKHFHCTITDTDFSFERDQAAIAREERLDGLYVIRTNLPADALDAPATVRAYKSLARVDIDQTWRLSDFKVAVDGAAFRRRQAA